MELTGLFSKIKYLYAMFWILESSKEREKKYKRKLNIIKINFKIIYFKLFYI